RGSTGGESRAAGRAWRAVGRWPSRGAPRPRHTPPRTRSRRPLPARGARAAPHATLERARRTRGRAAGPAAGRSARIRAHAGRSTGADSLLRGPSCHGKDTARAPCASVALRGPLPQPLCDEAHPRAGAAARVVALLLVQRARSGDVEVRPWPLADEMLQEECRVDGSAVAS